MPAKNRFMFDPIVFNFMVFSLGSGRHDQEGIPWMTDGGTLLLGPQTDRLHGGRKPILDPLVDRLLDPGSHLALETRSVPLTVPCH